MAEPKPHSPSLLSMLGITLPIIAVMFVLIVAFNTGDLLWFYPVFDEVPVGMTVHCYGETVEVRPGDPAFTVLNTAVNQVISGTKRWDQLSLSDVTYEEYQTSDQMVVLELYYEPPVRIHSAYKFMKNIDTIVIPLVGRHAQSNAIFGRLGEFIAAGSFHFKTMAPIEQAVQAAGLCQLP
jgi:hypothetical protein